MPIKTSSGKWKWGNIERDSKKELVQTVYGIWKKNGSKGSFSDFLKGTHESLDESFNLDKTNLYFHGSFNEDIKKIDKPSIEHPFCVTQDIQYALDYADGGDESDDSTNGVVYLVTIDEDFLKIFDFEDDSDIKKLNSKWPAKILECFSKKHKVNEGKLIDPLIVCDLLINDMDYSEDDSEITTLMNTSVLKRLEKFVGKKWKNIFEFRDDPSIKSGEYILRNLLLTDIKDLGFNGYRAHEHSGHSSDKCFILFDLDCIDKIFLQPILFKDAVAAAEYMDKKFSKSYVDIDYREHDAAIKEFIRSLKKTKQNMKESVDPKDKFFKVMKNGKEIGKYGLSFYDDIKAVGIGDFEVYPEFRNKGYGTKIIKDIVDRYKNDYDKIYCFVDKDNRDAIRLYKRLGKVSDEVTYSQKIGDYEYKNKNGQHYVEFYNKLKESYKPPYSLDTIKQKYGDKVYRKLRDDPVHRFRAKTGIEVIHKEPTKDEFERIVKNWNLMTPEQKKQSDEFSMKTFGNDNKRRIDLLRREYDFEVGDKVKVRKGLRCFQSGHTGKIIEIEPPDKYGWSSFVIKFDEPRLGVMGFHSGNIEKMNESVVLEDKTAMIKKLVLPDIEDESEKEAYKKELIDFFKSHSNFENKVDWNKFKTLTKKEFDEVIASADKTRGAEKRKEKSEITSDIKNIFKSQKGREFFIAGENDRWLFVAPLNYEAAKFCDSSENQGADAKWCIGYNESDVYWHRYIEEGSIFIMAFNKNYKNLSKEDLQTKLKFMIQRDKDDKYHVWNQPDKDTGDNLSAFGKEKQIADKMFDKVKDEFERQKETLKKEANRQVNDYLERNKDKLKGKKLDKDTNFKIIEKFKDLVTEVRIPEGMISIGEAVFSGCSRLTSIVIPDSVISIGRNAFYECTRLKSVTIPNSVTSIGNRAFYGCSGLTSIDIPAGVMRIGYEVFSRCSGLTSVTIPDGVTSIGDYTYYGCSGLTSITIPKSVISIGYDAFGDCSNLKNVYCSEKIWNKFRDEFPKAAQRKDLKEMKKESLNEAYEIHSYPEKLQPTLERIVKDNEDYELDHAYFNKEGKFIWMRNSKGYFHVFKPVKFVKTPGMTKPFGFKDLILKDNGMLEEVDRLHFANGNEGLKFLKDKYHLAK